jgi:hypothetical protein
MNETNENNPQYPVSGPKGQKMESQIDKPGIKILYYAEAEMGEKSVERSH